MITLAMPYYENPNMLREHIKYWQQYPKEIAKQLWVIVVDDGSPRNPAKDVLEGVDLSVSVRLYRIEENIPWNHGGARNLGFTKASDDGWVFSTDLDHVVPAESMQHLMSLKLSPECYYTPVRRRMVDLKTSKEYTGHIGTFIMTKRMFWKVGGFDEDFSGHYGGTSSCFRRASDKKAERVELADVWTLFFPSEVIADSVTTDWGRKDSAYDARGDPDMIKKLKTSRRKYDPKNHLRFNWERVI